MDHSPNMLRAARAWLGLSQKDAARAIGVSDVILNRAEKGECSDKTWNAALVFYASQGLHWRPGESGPAIIVIDAAADGQS